MPIIFSGVEARLEGKQRATSASFKQTTPGQLAVFSGYFAGLATSTLAITFSSTLSVSSTSKPAGHGLSLIATSRARLGSVSNFDPRDEAHDPFPSSTFFVSTTTMSRSPPTSPARGTYGPMPATRDTSLAGRPQYSVEKASSYLSSGRPATSGGVEHVQGAPIQTSVLSQSAGMHENGLGVNGIDEEPNMNRDESVMSRPMSQAQPYSPTRQGTLKKKASIKRQSSMKRTLSRKSSHAGSIRDQNLGEKEAYQEHPDRNSPFYCPVPTSGNPTEILASRFQGKQTFLRVSQ